MRPANMRARAYQTTNLISGLWALHRAGKFTYRFLQDVLKKSPSEQRKVLNQYSSKRRGRRTADIPAMKKQLRDLTRRMNNDLSLRTYRQRDIGFEGCAVNVKESLKFTGLDTTLIETALANLRYWSEATGAYVDASPTTTASNELTIKRVSSKLICRNNYQIPCHVEVYCCVPKDDTSIDPVLAFTNGLTDQDAPSSSSALIYLTDSDQFNSLWKIKSSMKRQLNPGQQLVMTYSHNKPFQYDPSLVDSHNLTYQSKYQSHVYVIRTSGVLSHDTVVANEVGFAQSAVDIHRDLTVVVEYDSGGPSLNDFVALDNSSTFTNGAVCSNNPVVDNQAYSVA